MLRLLPMEMPKWRTLPASTWVLSVSHSSSWSNAASPEWNCPGTQSDIFTVGPRALPTGDQLVTDWSRSRRATPWWCSPRAPRTRSAATSTLRSCNGSGRGFGSRSTSVMPGSLACVLRPCGEPGSATGAVPAVGAGAPGIWPSGPGRRRSDARYGFVHRPTRDLDLFSPQPEDVHRLADALVPAVRHDGGTAEVVRNEPAFVRMIATARNGHAVAGEIGQDARILETGTTAAAPGPRGRGSPRSAGGPPSRRPCRPARPGAGPRSGPRGRPPLRRRRAAA